MGVVLFALNPDVIIAIIAAYLTDSGLVGFVLVFLGLQGLYLIRGVVGSASSWVAFWLYARRQIAKGVLEFLRSSKYPEPEAYRQSAESYFVSVAADERQPIELRIMAGSEVGVLRAHAGMGLQHALRVELAYGDALDRYKRTFGSESVD